MDDLISRQALCEYALNQKDKSVTPNDIMRFPSVKPERKKGKWIKDSVYRCSMCEHSYQDTGYGFNFCPNCGADMREGQDETD